MYFSMNHEQLSFIRGNIIIAVQKRHLNKSGTLALILKYGETLAYNFFCCPALFDETLPLPSNETEV
jgi:hypothetical protein